MAPSSKTMLLWFIVSTFLNTSVVALNCFLCGQYNDGVGSITPCINETYMKLANCPEREVNFCIKYTSEGTVVRDCVAKCTERDNWDWTSRTFCCQEDACNRASHFLQSPGMLLLTTVCFLMLLQRFLANRVH